MDREMLGAAILEMMKAPDESQGDMLNAILNENDSLNARIAEMNSNTPEGYDTWESAYNGLKQKYLERFVGGSAEPDASHSEPSGYPSVTDACQAFVNHMFGK